MAKDTIGRDLVHRPRYLDALRKQVHTPDVKVLVGVRRCGKSSVLSMFADALVAEGMATPETIFFKQLDSYDVPLGYSASDLLRDIDAAIMRADGRGADATHDKNAHDKREPSQGDDTPWFHIFLDEIQDIDGWENVVRRLHSRPKTDVYITGSNARLLSGELATQLTGRYFEIPVYPLTFEEYLAFYDARESGESTNDALQGNAGHSNDTRSDFIPGDLLSRFSDYMCYGGMPGLFALGDRSEQTISSELRGIYESILFRDVAQRFGVRDTVTLEAVGRYLCSTSGTLFSSRKIANALISAGRKTSGQVVEHMADSIEKAYLLSSVEQMGLQGKSVLQPKRKYYPADVGFRNLMTGFAGRDLGAQLECVVFSELCARGWCVNVGTFDGLEIDFVVTRGAEKAYVQVTLSMLEDTTRERELRPLRRITDAFPRIVITLDSYSAGVTQDGIRIVNAIDWLCSGRWV